MNNKIIVALIIAIVFLSGCLRPSPKATTTTPLQPVTTLRGRCGDGICSAKENCETCSKDCKRCPKLELKQIMAEKPVTDGNAQYIRPEVIVIDGRIFFAFEKSGGGLARGRREFQLVELNKDLSFKTPVYELFSDNEVLVPHDIRLATDGTKLWYAFETADNERDRGKPCEGHHLHVAKYDVLGDEPIYEGSRTNIAQGCDTSPATYGNRPDSSDMPDYPEAVDDPAPIYFDGKYFVVTRAWGDGGVQHVRTFDQNFEPIDALLLDLGNLPEMQGRLISQNALVDIDGQIYIIGGLIHFTNPRTGSSIYAIPLSNDLSTVTGNMIRLVHEPGQSFRKVNSARYRDGKLYINYAKVMENQAGERGQYHHLGVFDVDDDFESLAQIPFQDESFRANHASVEVLGNRVYVFYNKGDSTGNHDIFGQVFEWR